MLEFKKYNSIENTYNKEFMEKIKLEGYDSLLYVVQEKVHGANCCFVTDGKEVHLQKEPVSLKPKRSSIIMRNYLQNTKKR